MTPHPDKAILRPRLRARRDAFVAGLSADERLRLEAEAALHLFPLIGGFGCVAFYRAVGSEISCAAAIERAVEARIDVALPIVSDDGLTMGFHRWSPRDPLAPGWRGLRQPTSGEAVAPEAFIVPLLGFDPALRRLGQGGGFYDRALAAYPREKKIGFGWAVQQLPATPCDPWDEALDAVVTERGVIEKVDL